MSNIKSVLNKISIVQIPENALLHGVVKLLVGRESFIDADSDLCERIYSGDIFEAIAGELAEMKDSPLYPSKKTIDQIEELANLIDSEYIQVTMI